MPSINELCLTAARSPENKNKTPRDNERILTNYPDTSIWKPLKDAVEAADFTSSPGLFVAIFNAAKSNAPPSLLNKMIDVANPDLHDSKKTNFNTNFVDEKVTLPNDLYYYVRNTALTYVAVNYDPAEAQPLIEKLLAKGADPLLSDRTRHIVQHTLYKVAKIFRTHGAGLEVLQMLMKHVATTQPADNMLWQIRGYMMSANLRFNHQQSHLALSTLDLQTYAKIQLRMRMDVLSNTDAVYNHMLIPAVQHAGLFMLQAYFETAQERLSGPNSEARLNAKLEDFKQLVDMARTGENIPERAAFEEQGRQFNGYSRNYYTQIRRAFYDAVLSKGSDAREKALKDFSAFFHQKHPADSTTAKVIAKMKAKEVDVPIYADLTIDPASIQRAVEGIAAAVKVETATFIAATNAAAMAVAGSSSSAATTRSVITQGPGVFHQRTEVAPSIADKMAKFEPLKKR